MAAGRLVELHDLEESARLNFAGPATQNAFACRTAKLYLDARRYRVFHEPANRQMRRGAALALDESTGLPAGDALHLVCAEQASAKSIATPDAALGRNAQWLKIKPVVFS